jgi:AraC family transcriptional regulator
MPIVTEKFHVKQITAMAYRKRVCKAMNFINQNLERELSLEEIADAAAFSMFHFHRIFKAVVGETVAGFTRRLRLELAANRLLANPPDDITTIAIACGFSSSQNFAKAFRVHFGTTPSDYRNRKNGNINRKDENAFSLRAVYDPDTAFANPINSGRNIAMNVDVKEMPDYHVAYVRKMGPYGAEICEQAFSELTQWAGPRGYLKSGVMIGVYWDNPEVTPPEKCRVDACISLPEGATPEAPIDIQTISGGPYSVCHCEIPIDGFQQAWEDTFAWLVDSGHECDDRPCYERYYNNPSADPDGRWIVDICIPLKRAR